MEASVYSNYTAVPSNSDVESDSESSEDDVSSKQHLYYNISLKNTFNCNREQFNACYSTIYDCIVCLTVCIDWIIDICTLFALFKLDNIIYSVLSTVCIILSILLRICVEPHSKVKQLFHPFISLKQLIDVYSNEIQEKGIFTINNKPLIFGDNQPKYSWFQLWLQDRYNIHRLQMIHCICQSFPHFILLYILLLNNEQITYNNNTMIYISFLLSLICIMICSPIYFQIFYYKLAHFCYFEDNTLDHYNLSIFMYNIFAFLSDFISLFCLFVYYNHDTSFTHSFTTTLCRYQFISVWIIIGVAAIAFFYNNFQDIIPEFRRDIRHVFGRLVSQSCREWINSYSSPIATKTIRNIGKILELIVTFMFALIAFILITILAEIVMFSWLGWLNISLFLRYSSCNAQSWEQLIFWLKQYENKNDLIVRLCCINYYLLSYHKSYKPIENLMNQCDEYQDITFKDIRRYSNLKSDALTGLLRTYAIGMNYQWKTATKWNKCCVWTLNALYFCSRTILAFIPIIGLMGSGTDFTVITILQWIYCILFLCTIGSAYGVFQHLYIFMHITPGTFHIRSFKSFRIVTEYYLNVKNNIKYEKQEKINILNDYFMKDIVNIIVKYLSTNSFKDDDEKQVETTTILYSDLH